MEHFGFKLDDEKDRKKIISEIYINLKDSDIPLIEEIKFSIIHKNSGVMKKIEPFFICKNSSEVCSLYANRLSSNTNLTNYIYEFIEYKKNLDLYLFDVEFRNNLQNFINQGIIFK